jgi:hypothetical protein
MEASDLDVPAALCEAKILPDRVAAAIGRRYIDIDHAFELAIIRLSGDAHLTFVGATSGLPQVLVDFADRDVWTWCSQRLVGV